ncbi:MAG: V4R domain-containing protein [Candidatus Jordarchaeaceae archaeon]
MKIEKTSVEFIDRTLGNLDEGTSMLFICDSFTLNDTLTLCGLVFLNFVKQGGSFILANTSPPFGILFENVKSRFAADQFPFIEKITQKGRVYFIDTISEEAYQDNVSNFNIIRIDNNLDKILYEILLLSNQVRKNFPDTPVMIFYNDFSSSIMDFGPKIVLKMFRKLTINAKQKGDIITGIVNRDLHDSRVINTLIHFADFVVELCCKEKGGVKQPYVQVLKSPISEPNVTNVSYAYIISKNSFLTITPLAPTFDNLKKNIYYNVENGEVSIYNMKYLITPLDTFLLLFKELEKNFGIKEYNEFVKKVGKRIGLELIGFFRSKYGLQGSELMKEAVNYLLIRGGGRLIKGEGSLESGRLKIFSFQTFTHKYGKSDYRICTIVEGIVSGVLEGVTGNKWTCNETNCITRGNELCEFEAKVEE